MPDAGIFAVIPHPRRLKLEDGKSEPDSLEIYPDPASKSKITERAGNVAQCRTSELDPHYGVAVGEEGITVLW